MGNIKLKVIEVQSGDTLWSLAERYCGDAREWRDLLVLNAVPLSEGIGDEMAKHLDVLTAGIHIVVPDDGNEFEPSGH